MDSFIHRFSSSRWPSTMQPQRRVTKRLIETTDAWSDVETTPNLIRTEANSKPMVLKMSKVVFTIRTKKQSATTNQFITLTSPPQSTSYVSEESMSKTSAALSSRQSFHCHSSKIGNTSNQNLGHYLKLKHSSSQFPTDICIIEFNLDWNQKPFHIKESSPTSINQRHPFSYSNFGWKTRFRN